MHLTLHLTPRCNMRCDYCYSPPEDGPSMSEEIALQALDLGARLNQGSSCGVIFFGGEPLLCFDLIRQIVASARQRERRQAGRFHFKLTTNGLRLDQEVLDFALREDILIALSIDGIAAAHDRHRRLANGEPSFELVSARLRALLAVRPFASVMLVVNPDTAEHLAASCSFLHNLGCRYLIVSLNYAADWDDRAMRRLKGQYTTLAKLYERWTEAGSKFYLSPFEVKIASHVDGAQFRKDRCQLARRQISVDSRGYLYPCVQFVTAGPDSEWCLGHVSTGIDEQARQRIHDRNDGSCEACQNCAIRSRCNNSCGCLNWQSTGATNTVSPVLCQHEQMLMPIADRLAEKLYARRNPYFLHKHYNAAFPVLSLLEEAGDGQPISGSPETPEPVRQ